MTILKELVRIITKRKLTNSKGTLMMPFREVAIQMKLVITNSISSREAVLNYLLSQ